MNDVAVALVAIASTRRTRAIDAGSIFDVAAAFVELSTDKIDLFWC